MKGQVVNLNRERWLSLANLALAAAASLDDDEARALGAAAGKMQAATPPASEPYAMALCLSFRWGCQAFGFADPALRHDLSIAVVRHVDLIRRLFDHHPAPSEAAALPVPVQPALDLDAPEPAWLRRADIGG